MKLSNLYNLIIDLGIQKDPRSHKHILRKGNPYADTRILNGNPDTEIRRILVGIDIEIGEILLADKLREDEGLDLALSHHPEGLAWAQLYKVMKVQADIIKKHGVLPEIAEGMLEERMSEVERRVLPNNLNRAVDAARILGIPFMCAHTPADNFANWYVQGLVQKKKPKDLSSLLCILDEVPEYKSAKGEGNPARIISGSLKAPVGKVHFEMTGGTEGPKKIYEKLYEAGVRTIVCMHLSEEHFAQTKDNSLNVVIAGHIASDNLGLNLLLDEVEKKTGEELQVISCSGFRRIRHL